MRTGKLVFRVHAVQRMFQRRISVEDVRYVLDTGEIIRDYPDDKPFPSMLILGWRGAQPLHVVAAHDPYADETIVITVYEPDPEPWEPDYKRKKQ